MKTTFEELRRAIYQTCKTIDEDKGIRTTFLFDDVAGALLEQFDITPKARQSTSVPVGISVERYRETVEAFRTYMDWAFADESNKLDDRGFTMEQKKNILNSNRRMKEAFAEIASAEELIHSNTEKK